ncbi:MAG: lysophospholipid acyltransferase family protein [Aequorivita sp.]
MQRLLYILVYPILWLLSKLPMRILYIKSTALFYLNYYVIGYRKKVVKENLALVFPEKTQKERDLIAKNFFKHLSDLIVETIKSFTISEREIRKRFVVTNAHILDPYYKNNRSILLMAGHYGNWEWSGILNKLMQHQAHAVYKPLGSKQFDALVKKAREHFGGIIVSNKKIVPVLFRKWKEGIKTLTYILSDQTPKIGAFKHRDTFMGIDVPMFTGTEELAKKIDFSVLYLKVEKIKRGYYTATFVPLAENPKEHPDFQITRMFFDALEEQIREKPEYYLWSHKRWKHRTRFEFIISRALRFQQ